MTAKILCVDDEQNVLDSIKRQLRKQFAIDTALGAPAALKMLIDQGPYAIVVSDMRMPEMDGVQLLTAVKQKAPNTVRIMLTGNADQQTAIEAINKGQIFRFLNKPCSREDLTQVFQDGLRQYRLVHAERELLEKTLRGSVKMLSDVLALVSPAAFGRATRVQALVRKIGPALKTEHAWQYEIAAMLSQIGCVTLPQETVDKVYHGNQLTEEETQMVDAHPAVGRGLVENIPRLEEIARCIAYQEKRFDGTGPPHDDPIQGQDLPLGARILKLSLDFDTLLSSGRSSIEAVRELKTRSGWYDPQLIEALQEAGVDQEDTALQQKLVRLSELDNHMILAQDIVTTSGMLVTVKGQEVTPSLRQRLRNFSRKSPIREPIQVFIKND